MADTVTLRIRVSPEDLAKIRKQIDGLENDPLEIPVKTDNGLDSFFGDLMPNLTKIGIALAGAAGAAKLLSAGFQGMIEKQDQLADLSAMTGLVGDELENAGDMATELSNKFGTSLTQNIEGVKVLISKLGPEVARDSDAMASMAENVNLLSKTSSGLSDTAATAGILANTLNAMGLSSADAATKAEFMARAVNVLAAGAKEGSIEADQISASLLKSGAVMQATGVTIEEGVAAIEVLGQKFADGAENGNMLKNVQLKLQEGRFIPKDTSAALQQAGVDIAKLTDNSLSLSERLGALKPIVNDTALITKFFGSENIVAAQHLIANAQAIDEMRAIITGTNTAQEQAAVKMATLSESWNRFRTTVSNAVTGGLEKAFNLVQKLGPVFTFLGPSIGAAAVAMGIYTLATNLGTIATSKAITAFLSMSKAMMTNPWVLTAAGIAMAVVALEKLIKTTGEQAEAQYEASKLAEENLKVQRESLQAAIDEKTAQHDLIAEYEQLRAKKNKTADETARYATLIKALKAQFPQLIESTDAYGISLGTLTPLAEQVSQRIEKLNGDMAKLTALQKQTAAETLAAATAITSNNVWESYWDNVGKAIYKSNEMGMRTKEGIMKEFEALRQKVYAAQSSEALIAAEQEMIDFVRRGVLSRGMIDKEDFEQYKADVLAFAKDRRTELAASGKFGVRATGPKEGDISEDGTMVFKGGKWVPVKPSGGGGDADAAQRRRDEQYRLKQQELRNAEDLELIKLKNTGASEKEILAVRVGYAEKTLDLMKQYKQSEIDQLKQSGDIAKLREEQKYATTKMLVRNSIEYLEDQLKQLRDQLKTTDASTPLFRQLTDQADELERKIGKIKEGSAWLTEEGFYLELNTPESEPPLQVDFSELEKQKDEAKQLGEQIGDALGAAIGESLDFSKAAESFTKFGRQMLAIAVDLALRELLVKAALGWASEIASKGLLGIITGGVASAAVLALAGKIKSAIAGFATGGVIVGENGPEIIAPAQEFSQFAGVIVSNAISYMQRALSALDRAQVAHRSISAQQSLSFAPAQVEFRGDRAIAFLQVQAYRENRAALEY